MPIFFLLFVNFIILLFISVFLIIKKNNFFHLLFLINCILFIYFILPYFFLYDYFLSTFGERYIFLSQFYFFLSYLFLLLGYLLNLLFIKYSKHKEKIKTSYFNINKNIAYIFLFISLGCFILLMYLSGGIRFYLTNLSASHVITAGKGILVIGIVAIKFFFFHQLISYFDNKQRKILLIFDFILTSFLLLIQMRTYFFIFLFQSFLFYIFFTGKIRKTTIIIFALLFLVTMFIYGEYRLFTGVAAEKGYGKSISDFYNYLKRNDLSNLGKELKDRIFLQYFDGNYVLLETISKIDKGEVQLQKGKTYLAADLFLKFVPRSIRTPLLKGISAQEEIQAPGFGFGRANTTIGVAFLNFSYFGAIMMIVFGFLASFVQENLLTSSNFKKIFWGIIFFPFILFVVRSSFVPALSLFLIDFFYAFLFILIAKELNSKKTIIKNI